LTWATLEAGAATTSVADVLHTLSQIDITCQTDGTVLIDGRALVDEIRTPLIDTEVSNVADHQDVRKALTLRMRDLRARPEIMGVVADGRDAGSVIFPDAVLKVFVDVSLEVRAQRRFDQQSAVHSSITLPQVHDALAERDRRDACRGEAAPRVLPDSRVLDNSSNTPEEAVGRLLEWVQAIA
jgi:cytidylate kinase